MHVLIKIQGAIMAKKKKEITSIDRKRRLQEIQEIHEKIQSKEEVSSFSRLSKVAYILWQYPNTRNSDRTHAIQYYKIFYPECVKNEQITFENLYILPKMYDLQRDRATIQNTEQLFPAKQSTLKKRIEKELEYRTFYLNNNPKPYTYAADYYLFLDESGKNDKYFVLGGVLINSQKDKKEFEADLLEIKNNLDEKYKLKNSELKLSSITTRNINYYLEFLEKLKKESINLLFVSVLIENSGLGQKSKKNKSKELLKLILQDCLSVITEYICRSSYANITSQLNVTLDNDGAGLDILEKEIIKKEMQETIDREYRYFSIIDNMSWENSESNILVQLADLYVGSINNIFSNLQINSENAKVKRQFAQQFLEFVGIDNISCEYNKNKNIEFINKCIQKK